MRELSALLDIFCTVNEGFWLYHLPDVMYEKRSSQSNYGKWGCLGFVSCFVLLVKLVNRVAVSSPYTILILIPCTIFMVFMWKCSIIDAFSICGGYMFANAFIGTVEISITGILGGEELIQKTAMVQGKERCIYILICEPIWIVLNFLLSKWLLHHKKQEQEFNKYVLIITAIGLGGTSFFTLSMLSEFNHNDNMGWYLFLTILVIAILSLYYDAKKKSMQEKIRLLDIQNGMLERNYETTTAYYTENAKLFHDINHHLDMIGQLLQTGKMKEAITYVESLREPLNLSKISVYTGIDVIDTILYETEQRAKQKQIKFEVQVQSLPQDIDIEKKDICALFANILDNAIEAADKEISIVVKMVYRMLLIEVTNDYKIKPIKENNRFLTSKQDYHLHGWGTQIIEQIVKKYDGSIAYESDDKFKVEVLINF